MRAQPAPPGKGRRRQERERERERVARLHQKSFLNSYVLMSAARSIFKHSREEIEFVARFITAVEVNKSIVTPQFVLEALLLGDMTDAWDAVFTTSRGITFFVDYDGSFFHTSSRLVNELKLNITKKSAPRALRLGAGAPLQRRGGDFFVLPHTRSRIG